MKVNWVWVLLSCLTFSLAGHDVGKAEYSLVKVTDSLYYVQLKTDSTCDRWQLPYPVYRFTTGDINGDGKDEVMVGVIKKTRHDRKRGRRLFIFKNYRGLIRPLWMGSRLGGTLCDFRFITVNGEPRIRSLESTPDGTYFAADYRWNSFGMEFITYLLKRANQADAERRFKENI